MKVAVEMDEVIIIQIPKVPMLRRHTGREGESRQVPPRLSQVLIAPSHLDPFAPAAAKEGAYLYWEIWKHDLARHESWLEARMVKQDEDLRRGTATRISDVA